MALVPRKIMKLESQVCSLELSKWLKELGVKHESLFWWVINFDKETVRLVYETKTGYYLDTGAGYDPRLFKHLDMYSAFTVAELGEMLPRRYGTFKTNNNTFECFDDFQFNGGDCIFHADTEADARAKMLIYLLENKLITL